MEEAVLIMFVSFYGACALMIGMEAFHKWNDFRRHSDEALALTKEIN